MILGSLSGACDVWLISLLQVNQDLTELESVLSSQERERAAAFLLSAPRRQFVVARAALRILLGRYLGVSPSACNFALNANGKPLLQPPSLLRFNLSHAGNLILIAISDSIDVGVDVEAHRKTNDLNSLAASILCPADMELWLALDAADRATEFYRIWTCKEAITKAIGCGLAMDFRSIRISIAPGRKPALVSLDPPWDWTERWTLQELETESGYSAAIAAFIPDLNVTSHALRL